VITYVDTSTLLKLLVEEDGSEQAGLIWDTADALASSVLCQVEGRAALAAARRAARISPAQHRRVRAELAGLVDQLTLVAVTDEVVGSASDLAEGEGLRGDDAVHLASALLVGSTVLTSADTALCDAAARRGLHVANPLGA
jgi:predicted nucleic acid-binding protein